MQVGIELLHPPSCVMDPFCLNVATTAHGQADPELSRTLGVIGRQHRADQPVEVLLRRPRPGTPDVPDDTDRGQPAGVSFLSKHVPHIPIVHQLGAHAAPSEQEVTHQLTPCGGVLVSLSGTDHRQDSCCFRCEQIALPYNGERAVGRGIRLPRFGENRQRRLQWLDEGQVTIQDKRSSTTNRRSWRLTAIVSTRPHAEHG